MKSCTPTEGDLMAAGSSGEMAFSTDCELLRHYQQQGIQRAFHELVKRYQGMVLATAFRRTGNLEVARDVAQEVFSALARKARSLIARPSLGGWLHQAAVYEASRAHETEVRRYSKHQRYASDPAGDLKRANANEQMLLAELDDALDKLSAPDREAILLRYFQGLSYAEISGLLDANEAAVRQRLSRAIQRLGACLRKRGVTANVLTLLLSVAGMQKAISARTGLSVTAIGPAAATGGIGTAFTSLIFPAFLKVGAVMVALAGMTAAWQAVTTDDRDAANADSISHQNQADGFPPKTAAQIFAPDNQADVFNSRRAKFEFPHSRTQLATPNRHSLASEEAAAVSSAHYINLSSSLEPNTTSAAVTPAAPLTKMPPSTTPPPDEINSPSSEPTRHSLTFSLSSPLPALLTELRCVELFPKEAAELYSGLLGNVLTLNASQRLDVEQFLHAHYTWLNSENLAGTRPSEVSKEVWRSAREVTISSAVNGVEQVLADVAPDHKTVNDIFTLVEKEESSEEMEEAVAPTVLSSVLQKTVNQVVDRSLETSLPQSTLLPAR